VIVYRKERTLSMSKAKKVKGAEIDVTSVTGKDRSIDVLYLRLLDDKVHRTYEVVEDEVLFDTNRHGDIVGIEILLPEKKAAAKRKPKAKKSSAKAKRKPRAKKASARPKKTSAKAKRPRKK
jgi:uncharacterized protein YuzE